MDYCVKKGKRIRIIMEEKKVAYDRNMRGKKW